jgi:hypothetical protein
MAAFLGCSSRVNEAKLSGNVTLHGAPVETGEIRFEPRAGKGSSAGAVITNGEYSAAVPCGPKIVHISGLKKIGEHAVYAGVPNSPKLPMLKPIGELNETLDVVESETRDFQLKPVQ